LLFPKQNLLCHFFINDSTDGSEEIIKSWIERVGKRFSAIQIKTKNFGTPPDVRGPSAKPYSRTEVFKSLARIRNIAIEDFLASDTDFLLFLDADVIIKRNALKAFLQFGKEFLCTPLLASWRFDKFSVWIKEDSFLRQVNPDILKQQENEVFEIEKTLGGCVLLARRILEDGLRFLENKAIAEFSGFSDEAKRREISLWSTKRQFAEHRILDNLLDYPKEIQEKHRREIESMK
jgi:glycosyltransferase involved in cell wall biosynthesis